MEARRAEPSLPVRAMGANCRGTDAEVEVDEDLSRSGSPLSDAMTGCRHRIQGVYWFAQIWTVIRDTRAEQG